MDNQQAPNQEIDLAFLAGLMEGEGCFSLHRRIRTDHRKLRNNTAPPVLNYKTHIAFSNSDYRLIEEARRIIDSLEVGYYIQWHGAGLKKQQSIP